ncbi:MAG: hypothetical protein LJF06_10755, partial [Gemmatimonadetes bacterium]|nr:hypothetical protein [Gemmatimonadota bacterium]
APRPPPEPLERRLTPKQAHDRALNQLIILDDHKDDRSEFPRRAVKDTTRMLWGATYLPDSTRALAAFAHAQAASELGEKGECIEWAQRASALAPANQAYRDFLGSGCGGVPDEGRLRNGRAGHAPRS